MLDAQCHPTIRRKNTSETNAVNSVPDQLGTRHQDHGQPEPARPRSVTQQPVRDHADGHPQQPQQRGDDNQQQHALGREPVVNAAVNPAPASHARSAASPPVREVVTSSSTGTSATHAHHQSAGSGNAAATSAPQPRASPRIAHREDRP
jgi:hypothetical protein